MKRYWLFIYAQCYPQGGMKDFYDSYDTIEECNKVGLDPSTQDSCGWYYHVYDSVDNIISVYCTDNTRDCIVKQVMNVPVNKMKDIYL